MRVEVLETWLKVTGRNYTWLAMKMGYTKGYISQIVNDGCRVSATFIEQLLMITHIPFNDLFYVDGRPDTREYYGEIFCIDGERMNKRRYFEEIRTSPGYIEK